MRRFPTSDRARHAAAGLALTAVAAVASPQTGEPTQPAEEEPRPLEFSLRVGAEHDFESRLDGPGDVSLSRISGGFGLGVPIGERSRLGFSLDAERSLYDFSQPDQLSPGFDTPFDDTLSTGFGVSLFVPETDKWGWFVAADLNASMEDGADFSDSLTYGGTVGVRYFFTDKFSAGFGVRASTRLEHDVFGIPAVTFAWQFAEQWRLSSSGRGVTLAFTPTEAITLSVDAAYERRAFRLDDHGFAPEGVAIDSRVPVALGIAWRPNRTFTVTARAGAHVWQQYKVEDTQGSKLTDAGTNPQGFVTLGVTVEF